jgi:Na+/melibiose symporter-like transporter
VSSGAGAEPSAPARTLSAAQLAAYGAPVLAFQFAVYFVGFFFLKFSTDLLLIAPATAGLISALGRLWDAVTDPIIGAWSDRTRSRLGRRRPWMLLGVPTLAATFYAIWAPPESLGEAALVAWMTLALLAFYTAFTFYTVPHLSLGAELTPHHHERSTVFGVFQAGLIVGMMGAFAAIQYVAVAGEGRAAARTLGAVSAALMVGLLLVTPLFLREPAGHQGRGAAAPMRALADVLRNPHARLLLMAIFLVNIGAGGLGMLAPFVIEYIVGRPDLIGVVPAFFVGAGVVSIPFWLWLSRRRGKRGAWLASMWGLSGAFGLTFFVGAGDLVPISLLMVAAGVAYGCGGVVGPSLLADVIDWDESRTGERREGIYSAAWGISWKAAVAVIGVVAGAALEASGFQPNVAQSEAASLTLHALFSLLPCAVFAGAALIFRRYGIDEAEHARIRAAIAARARA